ncbi:Hypothetical predicted protein [Pelobates cultripes]|uniref:Uncharacterized protein n=1 Tax=Pelobates cultripes TaxID=61616 RepID=A0AAD1R4S6_PELCU|nr:Hypothetical predicted protein [Pelobates cultripes]
MAVAHSTSTSIPAPRSTFELQSRHPSWWKTPRQGIDRYIDHLGPGERERPSARNRRPQAGQVQDAPSHGGLLLSGPTQTSTRWSSVVLTWTPSLTNEYLPRTEECLRLLNGPDGLHYPYKALNCCVTR